MSAPALPVPPGGGLVPPPLGRAAARQFAVIARIAHAEAALHLPLAKAPLVFSRLSKRLRALGLTDMAGYIARLEGPEGREERGHLVSALTTNVTRFFREPHHFDHFAQVLLPRLAARARAGGRVRLWSAGCASGPEPYSLAITLLEQFPEAAQWDIRILATDIDARVVAEARAGHYPPAQLTGLSAARRQRFFTPADGGFQICPELRALVQINRLNLLAEWPMAGRFDAIFCRNVMIYFDPPSQQRLIARFAQACAPEAALYLGHAERIDPAANAGFIPCGRTSYAYRPAAAPPRRYQE